MIIDHTKSNSQTFASCKSVDVTDPFAFLKMTGTYRYLFYTNKYRLVYHPFYELLKFLNEH